MTREIDIGFMREALRQAGKGLGRTSPNPAVGAVIVRGGRVLATGYHHKAGLPHAEVEALAKLGGKAPGATLYVTLEPCNHFQRTPPCTQAILKSGLKRVVAGMKDPNPNVSGGGCEFLKSRGIEVVNGVLESECRKLNEAFIKFITKRQPFVMLKSALTLDGWTATSEGHSRWITNDKSREFVHRLRDRTDALMVGVGTVLADDPSLTTRLKRGRGRDPIRVVVDTHLKMPAGARVLHNDSSAETLVVVASDVPPGDLQKFRKRGVSVIGCRRKGAMIDLNSLMDRLAEMSICSLLVEGGATIAGSMLRERLVDKCYVFVSPKILGGDDGIPMTTGSGPKKMSQALALEDIKVRRFGDDILVEGYPHYT